jgi:hypothetical protein
MITDAQREALFHFFGAYFHQDWALEATTPGEVIATFLQSSTVEALSELSQAIVSFVAEHRDDRDLEEALFKQLGCYFSPRGVGLSTRTWLLSVAGTFASAARS